MLALPCLNGLTGSHRKRKSAHPICNMPSTANCTVIPCFSLHVSFHASEASWAYHARLHREQHLGFDRMPRKQAQGIALRDRGQDQLHLNHRKGVANALAGSTPKGKIVKTRAASRPFWREAFRVEHFRLLPKCRVTVGTIDAEKYDAFGRNRVAANLTGRCGKTREAEDGRVEPRCLLDHHAGVGQSVQVFNRRQLPGKDGVQAALDLRILRKQEPGPGEGHRRRFMAAQAAESALRRAVAGRSCQGRSPRLVRRAAATADRVHPCLRVAFAVH